MLLPGIAKEGEMRVCAVMLTICSVDPVDLLGYEPDASVWYRVFRHFGSSVLATYDVGQ